MTVKFHARKSALCLSVATTLATLPFSASATTLDMGGFLDTTTLNVTDFASSTAISRSAGTTREAFGIFDINVTFTQTVSQSVLSAFSAAEQFWESRILGYETVDLADFLAANFPSVEITANIGAIDGVGGTLGSAGSTNQVGTSSSPSGDPTNLLVSVSGNMNFDSADLGSLETDGILGDVIRHEMAHVLGFTDSFWDFVGATDGSGTDLSYTGALALATYQNEFDPTAAFIPVEEGGGGGTAFAHWDELLFANNGTESNPELMTGFLEGPTTLSRTTLASFDDLGYVTSAFQPQVVPLPAPAGLLIAGLAALGLAGRRARPS